MTEPIIENLTEKSSIAGYRATWQESGLLARYELLPVDDKPANGFYLEGGVSACSGRPLGRKQQEQADKLLSALRERYVQKIIEAGWQLEEQAGQAERFHRPVVAVKRVLKVAARTYERTITAQSVAVTCQACSAQVIRAQYPGARPLYCEPCARRIEKEKARLRGQRLRAKKKLAIPSAQ